MSTSNLQNFIVAALREHETPWSCEGLEAIGGLMPPDLLFGGRDVLLKADIHTLWARWFVESLCDSRLHEKITSYAKIYETTASSLRSVLPLSPPQELQKLAGLVSRLLLETIERRKAARREAADDGVRELLLARAGTPARCWVCGLQFSSNAIERFRYRGDFGQKTSELPKFLDFFAPRGLTERDKRIEIDHVVPISSGGESGANLRLACGWCNRNKSDSVSIYDHAFAPLRATHPVLGPMSVPRPFWVVRILGVRRGCEYVGGCGRSVADSQLTVCWKNQGGAVNPCNLQVCCYEHDPLGVNRWVPSHAFAGQRDLLNRQS